MRSIYKYLLYQTTPSDQGVYGNFYCGCFGFILFLFIFALIWILLVRSEIITTKIRRFFRRRKQRTDEEKVKVEQGDLDYEHVSSKTEKKGSFFERIFKKEKVCEDCGTELEYREEYESYYCPECHTYK